MPPPLGHIYKVVQDIQGNIVPEVMGTVMLAGTSTPAALFNDAAGTQPLPNPLVNSSTFGSLSFYLDAGHYDLTLLKANYVFEPILDIQVEPGTGGIITLTGTPNQVLVSAPYGYVTLSTPQNLDPDAAIQFARLGLGTPATGDRLRVIGSSNFTGLAQFDNVSITGGAATLWGLTVNGPHTSYGVYVPDRGGDSIVAFHSGLNATPGTNRWFMYSGGNASSYHAGYMTIQAGLAVNGHTSLNAGATITGTLNTNTINCNYLSATNNIQGTYFGMGGAPDGRFNMRCYGPSYFDGNVNIASEAGHQLNVGANAYIAGLLGVGTAPYGGWNIAAGSILSWGAMQTNTLYVASTLTAASAVNVSGHLQGYSSATFNGSLRTFGNFVASLEAGFGREAAAGWSIATGAGIYCGGGIQVNSDLTVNGVHTNYGHVHLNSTLYCAGVAQFNSLVGIATTAVSGYWLRAGRTWVDDLSVGGGAGGWTFQVYGTAHITSTFNVAGRVDMTGDARVHSSLAVGMVEPAYEGYGLHVAPNVKFRGAAFQCDGTAAKPGGGSWADSNSMRLYKTNITPLTGGLAALLALHERQWDWAPDYPELEAMLPGPRAGFVVDEVIEDRPQWVVSGLPGEAPYALQITGFEALTVNALREIVQRLERLEGGGLDADLHPGTE